MFTSVVIPTPSAQSAPQRILIPAQQSVQSIPYTPPCSQYAPSSGSIVIASPTDIYANCTANSLAGPQYPPYDVHCTSGAAGSGALQCYELQNGVPTGFSANSIDGICCRSTPAVPTTPTVIYLPQPGWPPGPRPGPWPPGPPGPPGPPIPPCCRAGGVNACALCLERQARAGNPPVVPSSEHFGYMQRCRQMCPNL